MAALRGSGLMITMAILVGLSGEGSAAAPEAAVQAGAVRSSGVEHRPAAAWGSPLRVLPGTWTDVSAAIGSDGAVHLAAAGAGGVWYATDRTGDWVADQVLDHRSSSEWRRVSLALDADDRVTIALAEGFESEFGELPGRIWRITDRGRPRGSFSAPVPVTPSGSTHPALKTPGHTYLVRTGDVCVDVCEGASSRVWYQTDAPSGWVRRRLPGDGTRPDLRVDAAGRPRIVYVRQDGARTRIVHARAASRTGPFVTQVVAKPGGILVPRLALDPAGKPVIAWVRIPFGDGPARVSLATPSGDGWSVRAIGPGAVVAISLDAHGRTHLAIGGPTGVREVTVRARSVTTSIDAGSEVTDVELRYPGSGPALVAYIRSAPQAGVYVARR